jgi:hypothetical protein
VLLTFTDTIDVQIIQTQSAINFRDQFPVTWTYEIDVWFLPDFYVREI